MEALKLDTKWNYDRVYQELKSAAPSIVRAFSKESMHDLRKLCEHVLSIHTHISILEEQLRHQKRVTETETKLAKEVEEIANGYFKLLVDVGKALPNAVDGDVEARLPEELAQIISKLTRAHIIQQGVQKLAPPEPSEASKRISEITREVAASLREGLKGFMHQPATATALHRLKAQIGAVVDSWSIQVGLTKRIPVAVRFDESTKTISWCLELGGLGDYEQRLARQLMAEIETVGEP